MGFIRRFWNAVRPSRLDGSLEEELEIHMAMIEDEERGDGANSEEARRRTRQRFGDTVAYRERARDRDLLVGLETFLQDLRHSIRGFAKVPGFTAIVILMLALGIGINAAIFTLLNTIVLRPLPVPNADRLVVLLEELPGGGDSPPSWLDQRDLREQNHVFESLGAFAYNSSFLLRAGDETSRVLGGKVTPDYFTTLGVTPIAGRLFDASEMEEGRDNVVLMREDYWRANLNADPAILQRQIEVDGRKCSVVGILPAWFRYPWENGVIWAPLAPTKAQRTQRGWHGFPMIGRLKPGVTLDRARADINTIMHRLAKQYPDEDRDRGGLLFPLRDWFTFRTASPLLVLQCAALAIFLMTCANVSSLLLARYSTRRREFALRAALGASRWRQLRQHLTESIVLAGFGCLCGIAVAYAGVRLLLLLYNNTLPRTFEIGIDFRLILFTVGTTMAGAIAFGLTTALHERSRELNSALAEGGRTGASRKSVALRQGLVIAQVMFALILLAGAGELIRSFQKLSQAKVGIDTSHLLTMTVQLPDTQYTTVEPIANFFQTAVDRIQALPGVESVASINMLPVQSAGYNGDVEVAGLPPHSSSFFAEFRWVTGDYFKTMRIPLVRGRGFLPEEMAGKRKAVVINEAMVRALWDKRDPLGSTILREGGLTVVGVVGDVRQSGLGEKPRPEMYMPASILEEPITTHAIAVRSQLPMDQLAPLIRREIRGIDPQSGVYRVKMMQDVVTDSVAYARITASLLSLFACLALVLAGFGLYGVMSYLVAERRREFAIRAAIGAKPARLVSMVFRQSLTMVAIGMVLGIAGGQAVSRSLPSLLYGVRQLEPATLAAAIAVLAASAIVAVAIPALRTVGMDPVQALRQE